MPPPNILRIQKVSTSKKADGTWAPILRASYKIPAILHADTESRVVAKRNYVMAYEENMFGQGFYMTFGKDALLFDSSNTYAQIAFASSVINDFFRLQQYPGCQWNSNMQDNRLRRMLF